MTDIRGLAIERVIIHDVPPPDEEKHGPMVLTDAPVELDAELSSYFTRKLVTSLGARGLEVVADPEGDAACRGAALGALRRRDALVENSKDIARRLHAVQRLNNTPGLLAVADGELESGAFLALLKLERQQGLQFHINTDEDGRRTVDIDLLRDLTLTDTTRVFKTAVLHAPPGAREVSEVLGRVSDDQRTRSNQHIGVANFWMGAFLGCRPALDPAQTTREVMTAAETFINEHVADPETRARYTLALMASMQSPAMDFRPTSFASDHLDDDDVAAFKQEVRDAGVDPNATFQKDLSRVRVGGFKMTFKSGMYLIGDAKDLEERVDTNAERTIVRDQQDQLRGR